MKKLYNILIGWAKKTGVIRVSNAEGKLSDLRLSICKPCGLSRESKVLEIINGEGKYENQLYCTKCSCPCVQKSLVVDEKCPIGQW